MSRRWPTAADQPTATAPIANTARAPATSSSGGRPTSLEVPRPTTTRPPPMPSWTIVLPESLEDTTGTSSEAAPRPSTAYCDGPAPPTAAIPSEAVHAITTTLFSRGQDSEAAAETSNAAGTRARRSSEPSSTAGQSGASPTATQQTPPRPRQPATKGRRRAGTDTPRNDHPTARSPG